MFRLGDRVRVVSYGIGAYHRKDIVGKTGTVTEVLHEQVFQYIVRLDEPVTGRITHQQRTDECFADDELEALDDGEA